jgi:hypothetical protein
MPSAGLSCRPVLSLTVWWKSIVIARYPESTWLHVRLTLRHMYVAAAEFPEPPLPDPEPPAPEPPQPDPTPLPN